MSQVPFPRPHPTVETEPFWEGLASGRIQLPWCTTCNAPFFYPRAVCPRCWESSFVWREASGRAHIEAYAEVHRSGHAAFEAIAPYHVAVVSLDEGVRMTVLMPGKPSRVRVGSRVDLEPAELEGQAIVRVALSSPGP